MAITCGIRIEPLQFEQFDYDLTIDLRLARRWGKEYIVLHFLAPIFLPMRKSHGNYLWNANRAADYRAVC